jgi:UPF0716 protein FxsA
MFGWLLLLFTLVPIVELYFLIQIGKVVGGLETVVAVLLIGIAGAALAKRQGAAVLRAIQRATAEGRIPGRELIEGALVFTGAVLLITPGVFTDIAGLLVLLPPIRRVAAARIAHRFASRIQVTSVDFDHLRAPQDPSGTVIDVEPEPPER